MREKEVATLLDHILQRDKARFLLFQALLQCGDGFLDRDSLLSRRPLLGFGTDEAIGQNGHYQVKGLFAFCLRT